MSGDANPFIKKSPKETIRVGTLCVYPDSLILTKSLACLMQLHFTVLSCWKGGWNGIHSSNPTTTISWRSIWSLAQIRNDSDDENAYFLPHHPVFKASSSTTKVRVVFDDSPKTSSGYSINYVLCVGPIVQDDLLDIILQFRIYKVALVGDIAKITGKLRYTQMIAD